MSVTLFELTYRVARELQVTFEGKATGGTTGTLVDTNDRTEADDYWNGGTLWLIYDAGGASAAPEGEYSVVSDFANGTSTVSFRTSMTVAPASGDRYAIANKKFPLERLIQSVNMAIQDLGDIPFTDTTTIDSANNQSEYTMAAAANRDLRQVWLQNRTGDADDNQWSRLYNWYVQRTATGSADLLVFPYQLPSGYDVKMVYMGQHPELRLYTSKLSELVPVERVVMPATLAALEWYKHQRVIGSVREIDAMIAKYERRTQEVKLKPIPKVQKDGHIMLVGPPIYVDEVGEVGTVRLN